MLDTKPSNKQGNKAPKLNIKRSLPLVQMGYINSYEQASQDASKKSWKCKDDLGKSKSDKAIKSILTLKAPVTTAADDTFCDIFPISDKNKV